MKKTSSGLSPSSKVRDLRPLSTPTGPHTKKKCSDIIPPIYTHNPSAKKTDQKAPSPSFHNWEHRPRIITTKKRKKIQIFWYHIRAGCHPHKTLKIVKRLKKQIWFTNSFCASIIPIIKCILEYRSYMAKKKFTFWLENLLFNLYK